MSLFNFVRSLQVNNLNIIYSLLRRVPNIVQTKSLKSKWKMGFTVNKFTVTFTALHW